MTTDADVDTIVLGIIKGKYDPGPSRYLRPGPRTWTIDRIKRLSEMCAEGKHLKEMAYDLKVSTNTVHKAMKRYGILYPYARGDRS